MEITTHMPCDRPLWAGPQFTFKTFQKPTVGSSLPDDLVVDYSANANKIEISHKSSTNLSFEFKSSSTTAADFERTIPILPREKEETVKADINMAMSTPMDLPKDYLPLVSAAPAGIQRELHEAGTRKNENKDKEGKGKAIQLAAQPDLSFYDGDPCLED